MIRFVITCLFYTTIARWGYSEISLMFPSAVPYINHALAHIQIPTHNTWSRDSIDEYIDTVSDKFTQAEEAVQDIEDFLANRTDSVG